MNLFPFDRQDAAHLEWAAFLWNEACGSELAISPRFVAYNTTPLPGLRQSGWVAVDGDAVAGFVLASTLKGDSKTSPETLGYIDAIAVAPDAQYQGVGSQLLARAEEWLKIQECTQAVIGQSLLPFTAGLPVSIEERPFFLKRGYQPWSEDYSNTWDVARDLGDGQPVTRKPYPADMPAGTLRQAQPGDEAALLEFLGREFDGRWRYEVEQFIRLGGRLSDITLLHLNGRVEGFCWVTLPDSIRPLDRYFPHALPKPWGQLGPIGVAEGVRGGGWGGYVLQAGLEYLASQGTRGMVIDWTGLLGFYGRYGFIPYREYAVLVKSLSPST